MIIEVRHAQIVSVALAVRRLRRFVPIPFLQPRAGVIAAVTAVAAACGAGIWAGFVLNELKVAASTAAGVVILVGLIAGTGSGAVWGEIRAGLVETGSWWFYADRGVAPRSFLVGRHLVSRLARLVAGLCMVLTALLILAITNDRGADINGAGWSASIFAGAGAAACGLSFALLRAAAPARRRRSLALVATLTIVGFSLSAVTWAWQWAVSAVAQLGVNAGLSMQVDIPRTCTEALAITSLAVVAVAISSYVTLGKLSCQRPVGIAHRRPAEVPAGGQWNCPFAARSSAHRVVVALAA